MELVGQFAALGTAVSYALTSTMFTLAGREIGSALLNRTRLLVALLLIFGLHWLMMGQPFPFSATPSQWGWLAVSGFIGLVLGDAVLLQAFVLVGPRLAMLVMSLHPVIGTVLAWVFFGETLSLQELAGVGLTLGGVLWVVADRSEKDKTIKTRDYWLGLLCAFGGATGQAFGLITSKMGMGADFPPLSANLIRLLAATVAIWFYATYNRNAFSGFSTLREHPRAFRLLSLGAITGPVIGVYLQLVAVQNAPLGIASTLMSLTPVFLIPISYVVFGEKVTQRAIVGTLIAFAGTAMLFI